MKKLFTPNFFKFLLAFSVIILLGFVVLAVVEGNEEALDAAASVWYYPA